MVTVLLPDDHIAGVGLVEGWKFECYCIAFCHLCFLGVDGEYKAVFGDSGANS